MTHATVLGKQWQLIHDFSEPHGTPRPGNVLVTNLSKLYTFFGCSDEPEVYSTKAVFT